MSDRLLVRRIGRLFTASPAGVVEDAALLVEDGRIAWFGPDRELDPAAGTGAAEELDVGGALVTPGLVDAHAHPVYAGDRFAEIARRSDGASYAEIAALGGGISASVEATRTASPDTLESAVRARLESFLAGGATTVEAKTGYHLSRAGEIGALRLLTRLGREEGVGGVEVTFLGGHAVAPEWAGRPDEYIDEVASWCNEAREAGARHVDVFCDEGYFTTEQSRRLLSAGAAAGLLPRIHADELALTGGAELAAELGCASADHLLCVDEAGARALGAAGVVATLAPVTSLAMGRRPPVELLRAAGVQLALGSDHNPGTCGVTSMSLVVALAVAELGLSVAEAVTAATAGGAASLRLADRGSIAAGRRADLVAWPAEHEGAFAWSYGLEPLAVVLGGEPLGREPLRR